MTVYPCHHNMPARNRYTTLTVKMMRRVHCRKPWSVMRSMTNGASEVAAMASAMAGTNAHFGTFAMPDTVPKYAMRTMWLSDCTVALVALVVLRSSMLF